MTLLCFFLKLIFLFIFDLYKKIAYLNNIMIIIIITSSVILFLLLLTCILSSYENQITPIVLRMTSSMRQERMLELTTQIKSIEDQYETKEKDSDIENQIPLPNIPDENN